jgi:hypothetical protein
MASTTFSGPVTSTNGFIGAITGLETVTTLTAASTLTTAQSNTIFFLSSATEFVTTLPAPAAGLMYTFIVGAAPSGASYTIVTSASANIIKGQAVNAAGVAGDTGTADDTISFVDAQAVAGDQVTVISDGTSWFAKAFCAVAAGVTFTQAS